MRLKPSTMHRAIRNFVKTSVNAIGLDIIRLPHSPQQTLLGLRALPIRTVIDVGANRGQFAEYITRFFPQAQLYCFEPLAEPFKQLRLWADHQAPGRVHIFDVAIGETVRTADMFYHTDHSPSSSILVSTDVNEALFPFTKQQVRVPVPMTTLDNALRDVTLYSDILVKLDVQGYEDRVIRGGTDTFRQAKACIVEISLDRLYDKQADVAEIFFLLKELCYCNAGNLQQVYGDDGHVIYFDALFIKK